MRRPPTLPRRRRAVVPPLLAVAAALALAAGAEAQNLLANGDFDTDFAGWIVANGTAAFDGAEGSASGPGSLALSRSSGETEARQCAGGIAGGADYEFGADYRLDADFLNFCRVEIEEYAGAGCTGALTAAAQAEQTLPAASASFATLASTFTADPATVSALVRLRCDSNLGIGYTVRWDGAFLAEDASPPPPGPPVRFHLLAGLAPALYRLPGADGAIGTADDALSADPTTVVGSDPNYRAAFTYLAAQVAAGPEPGLPGGLNLVTYAEGTFDVDGGTGAPLAADLRITGFGQGLGITPLGLSNFVPTGPGAFEVDITVDVGTPLVVPGVPLGGGAQVLTAPFAPTGDPYVDGVLAPLASGLGAGRLLFADLAGSVPGQGVPFRMVIAAVGDLPPGSEADLAVEKTVDVAGAVAPGTMATYRLTVSNAGPATATGVVLRDRIPDDAELLSNGCGATFEAGGILTWSVGALAPGGGAACEVNVRVRDEAGFDFDNAAVAFGEQLDPDLDDNAAEARVAVLDEAPPGLAQPSDGTSGFQSDLDCDACPGGDQGIADSFKLDAATALCGVSFFGGYSDGQPFADSFRVEIRADVERTPGVPGVPGDLVASLGGGVVRSATGGSLAGGFDEYRYDLPAGLVLPRGRYWLLVVNDSSAAGGSGDWFWASGAADALGRSVPGVAFNTGIGDDSRRWGPNRGVETAFELCVAAAPPPGPEGGPVEVPAAGTVGLLLLAASLVAVGWRRLGSAPARRHDGAA